MHTTAQRSNIKIVQLPLDLEDDIDATNAYGDTALMVASQYGQTAVVKLLLSRKANADEKKPARRNGAPTRRKKSSYGNCACNIAI